MTEQSHLAKFAEFVIGDDSSELGIARAERDYALHCLEREIAICATTQTHLDQAEVALGKRYVEIADLRMALKQIQRAANDPDCNERFRIDLINTIATEAIIA